MNAPNERPEMPIRHLHIKNGKNRYKDCVDGHVSPDSRKIIKWTCPVFTEKSRSRLSQDLVRGHVRI